MISLKITDRLGRARLSLEGLSVGDAFGERFFVAPDIVDYLIENRAIPRGDWKYQDADSDHPVWFFTDDTNMALSLYASLRLFGEIKQDWLADSFAARYHLNLGYGPAMHRYLNSIREGADWRIESGALFGGRGSFGNGAAMRVAPLGAYFAGDMKAVIEQARLSAEVTHAHEEGIAGAIAIAVATALVCEYRTSGALPEEKAFLEAILPYVPESVVHERIRHARNLTVGASVRHAVAVLGNGAEVTAQDTVSFALWCASQHLDDFEKAMWKTVSGLGDRDTTCAIVGGIVACYTGEDGIPAEWLQNREPLPDWVFVGDGVSVA